jgi:superfamily II DNA or RNA helicase
MLQDIPIELRQWFVEQLTIPNPKYKEARDNGRSTRLIPEFLRIYRELGTGGIEIPRGCLQLVEEALIGQGFGMVINDSRVLTPPISVKSNIVLHPHQEAAKFPLLSHPNGMLVAPAASGKTIIGLDLFASLHQRTLWITHTNRLFKQVKDRILQVFEDITPDEIGILGSGKFQVGERITIGMIPTLVRRINDLPEIGREFGLVILDEAHHAPASTFLEVLSYFASFYMYGLTATPHRRDGLEDVMFATIGLPNAIINRREVVNKGAIVTPKVCVRNIRSGRWDGYDFHEIVREVLPNNLERTRLILDDVLREATNGHYCIIISTRKSYCEFLYESLKKTWEKTAIATGDYTRKHNDLQVKRLEEGEITVLVTTFELLGEGFDVKKLDRGFIVLPFREKARVEQTVGRIQRACEGKKDAILYDYVDIDIGMLKNQFYTRALTYRKLGMEIKNV